MKFTILKTNIILSIIITFLISCGNESQLPDGILKKDQMVNALIQVHLSEAKCGQSFLKGDTSQILFARLQEAAFSKLGITKPQYDSSYQYYMRNLGDFDEIYARVVDSLSLKEQLKSEI